MERRRALAIAAAVSTTTVGAMAAIAANFGLLGLGAGGSGPLGKLDAGRVSETVDPAAAGPTAPPATVRYEDIYLPAVPAPTTRQENERDAGARHVEGQEDERRVEEDEEERHVEEDEEERHVEEHEEDD